MCSLKVVGPFSQSSPATITKDQALIELNAIGNKLNSAINTHNANGQKAQGKPLETLDFSLFSAVIRGPLSIGEITSAALKRLPDFEEMLDNDVQELIKKIKTALINSEQTANQFKDTIAYLLPYLDFFQPIYSETLSVQKTYRALKDNIFITGLQCLSTELEPGQIEQLAINHKLLIEQVKRVNTALAQYQANCSKEVQPFVSKELAFYKKREEILTQKTEVYPFINVYLPHFSKIAVLYRELDGLFTTMNDPYGENPTQDELDYAEERLNRFTTACEETRQMLKQYEKNDSLPPTVKKQIFSEIQNIQDMLDQLQGKWSAVKTMIESELEDETEPSSPAAASSPTHKNEADTHMTDAPPQTAKVIPDEKKEMHRFILNEISPFFWAAYSHPSMRNESLEKIIKNLRAHFEKNAKHQELFYSLFYQVLQGHILAKSDLVEVLCNQKTPVPAFLPLVQKEIKELQEMIPLLSELIKSFIPSDIGVQWIKNWQGILQNSEKQALQFEMLIKAYLSP